jgi:hypothetical protein
MNEPLGMPPRIESLTSSPFERVAVRSSMMDGLPRLRIAPSAGGLGILHTVRRGPNRNAMLARARTPHRERCAGA